MPPTTVREGQDHELDQKMPCCKNVNCAQLGNLGEKIMNQTRRCHVVECKISTLRKVQGKEMVN